MACTLTLANSRKLPCIKSRVGIRAIYVFPFDATDKVVTTVAGVVALPTYIATTDGARYDIKSTTANYTDTLTQNLDNRSGGRKGELPVIIVPNSGVDNVKLAEEIDQISKTESLIFLEMKNGDTFAIGSQFGCNISTAVDTTGGQSGDLDGVTMTIQTDESDSFRKYWLSSTAVTALQAAVLPHDV